MKIFLAALALFVLPLSAPAVAYGPDWSQPGDYYAPDNTAVQPLTPREQNLVKDGDYYAPSRTIVEQPTAEQLKQDREGDYYAPVNGK
jgi:hypothetical protein